MGGKQEKKETSKMGGAKTFKGNKSKKERRGWTLGGYFTVEASLVLPMVIGTVIFVICVLLFWYNRCLMDQDAAMLSVKVVQISGKSIQDREQALKEWRKEFMTDKHYGWDQEDPFLSQRLGRITIRQSGKLILGDFPWMAETVYENADIHPASFLRLCRRMNQDMEGQR